MTTTPVVVKSRLTGAQWGVLSLLVLSILINYVDRGNLSVAAPPLKVELNLTPEQLGLLLSSFFWTYAAFQFFGIAGWLVDRLHVGWVLAAGFFLWSGATAGTGLVGGFAALFALRLILGMGESIAYPAYSRILAGAHWEAWRGTANAFIDAGSKFGPAIGTLIGGTLIARFGWRPFFIVLGVVSLAWLVPWIIWMPKADNGAHREKGACPTVLQILRQRSAWGTFAGLFSGNYYWYFLLTWLPYYLVKARGFSMDKMATFGALAYLVIGISAAVCGWLSDRWIAAGASTTKVRKTFTSAGLGLSTVILCMAMVKDETTAMALLMLACATFGMFSSNHWAVTQTLAGPLAAGRWTSLQNGVGNFAGVTAPWVTGWIVQETGSFFFAFAAAAAVLLAGSMMYLFVIGPIHEVDWGK